MNSFQKEFVIEMFLENESTTTLNRLVTAAVDVVQDNIENMSMFDKNYTTELIDCEIYEKEHNGTATSSKTSGPSFFYENVISMYNDEQYERTFKMKRSTCQELIKLLTDNKCIMTVPLAKKVHVFLWLLTSDDSFLEVGNIFGLSKSTVSYIFHEIAESIMDHQYRFIAWPSIEEQEITRMKVNSHFNFPNCVGFIDACRFRVGSKRNKKGKPEIVLLQAVCDESLMFTDIHVGPVGRTKKWKVYKESSLSQELRNFIDFENHILCDSQYKLRINLITPFSSDEVLTAEEMKFNELHWNARMYIGRAFEILKLRFRKLNLIDVNKLDSVKTILSAACVLHNFIIMHEGTPEIKDEPVTCSSRVVIDSSIVKTASEKRQFICNYISLMESY